MFEDMEITGIRSKRLANKGKGRPFGDTARVLIVTFGDGSELHVLISYGRPAMVEYRGQAFRTKYLTIGTTPVNQAIEFLKRAGLGGLANGRDIFDDDKVPVIPLKLLPEEVRY